MKPATPIAAAMLSLLAICHTGGPHSEESVPAGAPVVAPVVAANSTPQLLATDAQYKSVT